MRQVDPVILELRADISRYTKDLGEAQRTVDGKLAAIETRGQKMGAALQSGFSAAKTAMVAFVAAEGLSVVTNAIKAGLDYASALGEQAQQLGVTTAALQEYRYAATQAGLSDEDMDQALSQLTRRLGEAANGTKAQAEAFAKLGISVRDANGEVINAGDALPMIAEAMKGVHSPAERAAVLMDLFGRSGQKLEPLLSGGAKGVATLREEARKLGIVLSDKQIQDADETADKLATLNFVLRAKLAGAVTENAGAIMKLVNALAALIDKAGAAVTAYERFKLRQGMFEAGVNADLYGLSPLPGDQKKSQEYRARQQQYKRALQGPDTKGSLRDYRAAPLKIPGSGGAMIGMAAGLSNLPLPQAVIDAASGGARWDPTRPARAAMDPRDWVREATAAANEVLNQMDAPLQEWLGTIAEESYAKATETANNILQYEFEERQAMLERARDLEAHQIDFLAGLFEDAFRGGTQAIWRDFKDIGLSVIAQLLARFAVARIQGNGFNFGDALGSILGGMTGGIFGKASGGRVNAGQFYRVNEAAGAGRVEGFIPQGAGEIIPLGRMNALMAGTQAQGGVATVRIELSGDLDARIQQVSGPVAVQVVRAASPRIIDASARETMARGRRPTL